MMFLLAEPHFAMTLPLLYGYKDNFIDRPTHYVLIPLSIIIIGSLIFFKANGLFIMIFLLANLYHVNRQSVGLFMVQGGLPFSMKSAYEVSLHIFTLACLYIAIVIQGQSVLTGLLLFSVISIAMLLLFKIKTGLLPSMKDTGVILQGYLIFLPVAIFSDMLLAFSVGVSIHYLQYISLSWRVCKVGFAFKMKIVLLLIIFYSILSTTILSGFITEERVSVFILIPTMMQLLHFYYDSLIWRKGSDILVAKVLSKSL
ncbi:hypothetical protein N9505_05340 [Candidatus Thioglobus sp.]|nr:hypothetical protein [Candidatus Thioglobus sp.]